MLSTDRTIFVPGSPARMRMEEYAKVLGRLSVVVCNRGHEMPMIGEPLSIYPTNSFSRFSYGHDAVRVALAVPAFDVVSAQDPFETGRAGAAIARRRKVPLHVQVHTDFLAPGFAGAHWPWNAIRMILAPRVLRRAARIRAVSASIKEHIEARYHPTAPVSVLPIFTDAESFKDIPKARHPRFETVLLVVSRLEKEKRVSQALEALKKARTAGFKCGLVVVGSGREEGSLRRLAKGLGVAEWVEFTGFQNNLVPYYAMADVLLYPGASYEGHGMTTIESLAAGVPVLANDVGIAREAGAEIAEGDFGDALVAFLRKPPAKGVLRYQPYASKEDYLQKFSDDIKATLTHG